MRLPSPLLALLLASPLVDAQRIKMSKTGCLLDLSEQVAGEIKCGKRSTVSFAVEWYGTKVEELQSWLKVAGCSDDEAKTQAAWAAKACQGNTVGAEPEASRNHELRHLHQNVRRLKETEKDTKNARDDAQSSSTLSTSTITSVASPSSSNSWVLVLTSNGVKSTETCGTLRSFTTSFCSSYESHGKWYTPCTTAPTSTFSCIDGFSCAFSTTNGNFSCYAKGTVPTYGIVIGCILGGLALCMAALVFVKCGMDRAAAKRAKLQREAVMLQHMGGAGGKGASAAFGMPEVEVGLPGGQQHISDTQPLMVPEFTLDHQIPGLRAGAPDIVVQPHTPGYEHHDVGSQMPQIPYDPYLEGSCGYRR
ncbi:hypothetical protein M406DRAFT_69208 [Cryphonectria parasitica EP155]|uniref:Uncharacterized protein n=1 Tax=Cryphonectria parasitica (strain ATCC 38755 / EP155) TaxID=660469 RepID=A0A9P4Y5E5_CRYP1|nr:uncharacterized protein M406DRAFT_69208 [Cryphonectria parasitica EP155]KAF3767038.1 hypothetical protein M406DRAFT_69208 [Cryphonectria parasitica EP155]